MTKGTQVSYWILFPWEDTFSSSEPPSWLLPLCFLQGYLLCVLQTQTVQPKSPLLQLLCFLKQHHQRFPGRDFYISFTWHEIFLRKTKEEKSCVLKGYRIENFHFSFFRRILDYGRTPMTPSNRMLLIQVKALGTSKFL